MVQAGRAIVGRASTLTKAQEGHITRWSIGIGMSGTVEPVWMRAMGCSRMVRKLGTWTWPQ